MLNWIVWNERGEQEYRSARLICDAPDALLDLAALEYARHWGTDVATIESDAMLYCAALDAAGITYTTVKEK